MFLDCFSKTDRNIAIGLSLCEDEIKNDEIDISFQTKSINFKYPGNKRFYEVVRFQKFSTLINLRVNVRYPITICSLMQ